MQYDIDIEGKFSDLFIHLRKIILGYEGVKEIKNEKQTSYRDSYGRTVCMMRSRGDVFVLAFSQGSKLQDKYPF